jgi:hypothetical protein
MGIFMLLSHFIMGRKIGLLLMSTHMNEFGEQVRLCYDLREASGVGFFYLLK